ELEDRERVLLREHGEGWAASLRGLVAWWEFRRGVVEAVGITANDFLQRGGAISRQAPVREVRLGQSDGLTAYLAESPALEKVASLVFYDSFIGDGGL